MTDNEFETYWQTHRNDILAHDEEYRRAKENFKITSGSDLMLFGIPVATGIVCMNYAGFANELLNWLASAVATIVCFALCVWIKSAITGSESPDEVERKIKERTKDAL